MSAHDDFMDVRAAFEAYDRAYVAWGKAVDGKPPAWKGKPNAVKVRAGLRQATKLRELMRAACEALEGLASRNWRVVPKRQKAAPFKRFAYFGSTDEGTLLCGEEGILYTLKGKDFSRLLGVMVLHMDAGDFEVVRGFLTMLDAGQAVSKRFKPKRRRKQRTCETCHGPMPCLGGAH